MWNWQIHSSLRHQNLPNTITKVILIVFTFALGMRPLELARLQSSLSRAIFLRLASVRGTEMRFLQSQYPCPVLIRSLLPHLASSGQFNIVRNVSLNWTGGEETQALPPCTTHWPLLIIKYHSLASLTAHKKLQTSIEFQISQAISWKSMNEWTNVYRFHFLKFLHKLTFIYIYYQFWQAGWSTIFLQTGFYRDGQWMGCNY